MTLKESHVYKMESIQDYLQKRRPIYVVKVPNKDTSRIVYDPTKLPQQNVIIVAPLNTDLSGWDKMVKRDSTCHTFSSIPQ
jgi:hypothetical protein